MKNDLFTLVDHSFYLVLIGFIYILEKTNLGYNKIS
ncbi:MAG: hypothetical protein K0R54_4815 [Clostridiaceae bacterium]|jgi:hypothetical protein|nr:hypothetical protein [Clostridiaceae bacterium]